MCKNVHSSSIYNSPKLETIQMSVNNRLDKYMVTQWNTRQH